MMLQYQSLYHMVFDGLPLSVDLHNHEPSKKAQKQPIGAKRTALLEAYVTRGSSD